MRKGILLSVIVGSTMASVSWPLPAKEATPESKAGVIYKPGKDLNFEQLIIEGQLKRPELNIVTGDDSDQSSLLRLRDSFSDQMAVESGEDIP